MTTERGRYMISMKERPVNIKINQTAYGYPKSMTELGRKECRWPVGKKHCCAPIHKKSYCEKHLTIAYANKRNNKAC